MNAYGVTFYASPDLSFMEVLMALDLLESVCEWDEKENKYVFTRTHIVPEDPSLINMLDKLIGRY